MERRARTSKGGTILKINAFSRNFQEMGLLFSQQIWETKRFATSGEGRETPAEFNCEERWIAHINGSCDFFVDSRTVSNNLKVPKDIAISGTYVVV